MSNSPAVMKVIEIAEKQLWQGYHPGDNEDEIEAAFKARYNRPPDEVKLTGGATLAGPISEEEHRAKCQPK